MPNQDVCFVAETLPRKLKTDLLRRLACQSQPGNGNHKPAIGGVQAVTRNPPNEQKPNLWGEQPVAKKLAHKHCFYASPNILLDVDH